MLSWNRCLFLVESRLMIVLLGIILPTFQTSWRNVLCWVNSQPPDQRQFLLTYGSTVVDMCKISLQFSCCFKKMHHNKMKFPLDISFPSENSLGKMSWAPAWYSKQAAIIWRRVPIMVAACVRKDKENEALFIELIWCLCWKLSCCKVNWANNCQTPRSCLNT